MIVETLGALLALATASPAAARIPGTVAGNVVIVTPEDSRHRQLRILIDSGGYDLIESSAADALGLARTRIDLDGNARFTVAFPDWMRSALPVPETAWLIARPGALHEGFAPAIDATLGPSWMLEHSITVDYPRGTIESANTLEGGVAVPLTVGLGRPVLPSLPPSALVTVEVSVAGERFTMLLDTGATARVLPRMKGLMPDAEPIHQVCLIEETVLARWHGAHRSWRYVEAGFDVAGEAPAAPTILVPDLWVGSAPASPTWFVARRDPATFAAVSKQMRKTVVGDLGGDALRRWRVTFDLKNERLIVR